MKNNLFLFILFAIALLVPSAQLGAQEKNDKASAAALQKTVDLLEDRKAVDKYAESNPAAKLANEKAKSLTGGGQNLDDIYALSSSIFKNKVKGGKASAQNLESWMLKAQANPKAFFDGLTPEQKAAIKSLAGKIESSRKPSSP